ncbi:hypothetical protein WKW79_04240 [Variovorax robiniae]|uniref:Uncharacterized protein n=1 Tax=Variovorax robiniae TaxID=1836199 RepID=A0ABU8X408_9BURK
MSGKNLPGAAGHKVMRHMREGNPHEEEGGAALLGIAREEMNGGADWHQFRRGTHRPQSAWYSVISGQQLFQDVVGQALGCGLGADAFAQIEQSVDVESMQALVFFGGSFHGDIRIQDAGASAHTSDFAFFST